MVTPVNGTKITAFRQALSQKGAGKIRVLEAGLLSRLKTEPLSDRLPGLVDPLKNFIREKLGIDITEIFCDLEGRLALQATNLPYLERVRNSNGNLGVLGHTVVIEMETEASGRLYLLKNERNTTSINKEDPKPKTGAPLNEPELTDILDKLRLSDWGDSQLLLRNMEPSRAASVLLRIGPEVRRIGNDFEYFIIDEILRTMVAMGGSREMAKIMVQMAKYAPDCAAAILKRTGGAFTATLMSEVPALEMAEMLYALRVNPNVAADILSEITRSFPKEYSDTFLQSLDSLRKAGRQELAPPKESSQPSAAERERIIARLEDMGVRLYRSYSLREEYEDITPDYERGVDYRERKVRIVEKRQDYPDWLKELLIDSYPTFRGLFEEHGREKLSTMLDCLASNKAQNLIKEIGFLNFLELVKYAGYSNYYQRFDAWIIANCDNIKGSFFSSPPSLPTWVKIADALTAFKDK